MEECRIVRESPAFLPDYARIPISFHVTHHLEPGLPGTALGAVPFRLQPVDPPYVKDYDAIDGCRPAGWPARWDVGRWWIASCFVGKDRVGGAAVAFDTPGLEMLGGRRDVAVLWDIRVLPARRRQGIGARLFRAAEGWARSVGCRRLVVETQDVNVDACRFYARQGCTLASIDPHAYPGLPGEAQLIWHKDLDGPVAGADFSGNSAAG